MSSAVPLIAIPGRLSPEANNVRGEAFAAGQRYARAVNRAGGQALILPPIVDDIDRLAEVLSRMDGLVLHGGGDVNPARYGETASAEQLYGIVDDHDAFELAALDAALELDLPVLAICRGMQILNVALGGTLNQDIGSEDHWFNLHPATVSPGSRLAAALGTIAPQACHSVHHQSLKAVSADLRVVARGADGMVEGVEYDAKSWVVGVQWHPEDTAADDPVQQRLFDALISQCRTRLLVTPHA